MNCEMIYRIRNKKDQYWKYQGPSLSFTPYMELAGYWKNLGAARAIITSCKKYQRSTTPPVDFNDWEIVEFCVEYREVDRFQP